MSDRGQADQSRLLSVGYQFLSSACLLNSVTGKDDRTHSARTGTWPDLSPALYLFPATLQEKP
jgi:hypothetical protein